MNHLSASNNGDFPNSSVIKHRLRLLALAMMAAVFCPTSSGLRAVEMQLQVLHEFFPGNGAPRFPIGRVVQGNDGCFYGTSQYGGDFDGGTVFKITTHGTLTTQYSFASQPNYFPGPQAGGMTQTANGDFYGVAHTDDPYLPYNVFRFRTNGIPPVEFPGSGTGEFGPRGGLAYDGAENLYGTARQGGSNLLGSVLRITTNGTFTTLVTFNGTNGASPLGSVVLGNDGNLYGTTAAGGVGFTGGFFTGSGTAFKLTTNGELTTLVYFNGTNGMRPVAGLTRASDGNFYGTTAGGGAFDHGTVFRMTPDGALTTLVSFDGTNGGRSDSEVAQGPDGKFYGVTALGPANTNAVYGSFGTVYSVTTNGVLTSIAKFDGTNAQNPFAELCFGNDGNLYGLTSDEARNLSLDGNSGIFFRLAQVPQITSLSATNGTVKLNWTAFTNGIYRVERRSSLTSSNWTSLFPDVTATGNTVSFVDSTPIATVGYYRVVLLP